MEANQEAKRDLARRTAAALGAAMSETDTSLGTLADRLGKSESELNGWMLQMMDGHEISLRNVGAMANAMGCSLKLTFDTTPPAGRTLETLQS